MDEDVITKTPSLTRNIALKSVDKSFSMMPGEGSQFEEGFSWTTLIRYILILIIVVFLIINLSLYLGWLTKASVDNIFNPLLKFFGGGLGETVHNTASGTKHVLNLGAQTLDSGISLLEKGLTGKNKLKKGDMFEEEAEAEAEAKAPLNNNKINLIKKKKGPFNPDLERSTKKALDNALLKQAPRPDEAGSKTQGTGKSNAGYCYIGEDRGFRSCIQVNAGDTCMSGDIFPSRDICINPNLRE